MKDISKEKMYFSSMNIEYVTSLAVTIEENIANSNMKRETFGVKDSIKKFNSVQEFQSKIESKRDKSADVMLTVRKVWS